MHFYSPEEDGIGTLRYTHGARGPYPRGPQGLPLFKPPYSRMTAIDLNTGEHVWMKPIGNGDHVRNHDALKDLDLPPLGGDGSGGPVITKTLLINGQEIGGRGSDEGRLVAWDKSTGEEVGAIKLPDSPLGTPMTFMLEGKQYIALTIRTHPPELIALTLP